DEHGGRGDDRPGGFAAPSHPRGNGRPSGAGGAPPAGSVGRGGGADDPGSVGRLRGKCAAGGPPIGNSAANAAVQAAKMGIGPPSEVRFVERSPNGALGGEAPCPSAACRFLPPFLPARMKDVTFRLEAGAQGGPSVWRFRG